MKILKLFKKIIFTLLFFIFLISFSFFTLLQFDFAQKFFIKAFIEQLEKQTGLRVDIKETTYSFPIKLDFKKIQISQEKESIAKIDNAKLQLSFYKLLEGRLVFPYIHLSNVFLDSLPIEKTVGGTPSSFPFFITLEDLKVEHLKISSTLLPHSFLEKEAVLDISLNGMFKHSPFFYYPFANAEIILNTHSKTLLPSLFITADLSKGNVLLQGKMSNFSHDRFGKIDTLILTANSALENWEKILFTYSETPVWMELNGSGFLSSIDQPFFLESKILFNDLNQFLVKVKEIKTPIFSLTGKTLIKKNGKIEESEFSGQYQAPSKFKGDIKFQGEAKGSLDQPSLLLEVAPEIEWKEIEINKIFKMKIDWDEKKHIHFTPLNDPIFGGDLKGSIDFSPLDYSLNGKIEGVFKELSHSFFMLDSPVEGTVFIKANFSTEVDPTNLSIQTLQIEATGENLTWKENYFHESKIACTFKSTDQTKENFLIEGDLEIKEFKNKNISLDIFQTPIKTLFNLKKQGFETLSLAPVFSKIKIQDVQIENLESQADLIFEDGKAIGKVEMNFVGISQDSFKWNEGKLTFDLSKEENQQFIHFKTNKLSLKELNLPFSTILSTGFGVIEGTLQGNILHPEGKIEVQLSDIEINDPFFKKQPLIFGTISANLEKEQTKLEGSIKGMGSHPFLIKGSLPFSFDFEKEGLVQLGNREIDLTLEADGELDPYLDLFGNEFSNLTGQASFKLFVNGFWNHPKIKGSFDLKNGTFESANTGALFHGITAHLEGEGEQIHLTSFYAEDSKQGIIKAEGIIKLDSSRHFPFEGKINTSKIDLVKSDYASLSASGDLVLKGNTEHAVLSGLLKIDHASIRLEAALPTQVKTVDVTYINLPEGELASIKPKEEKKNFLDVDISMELPENLNISGNNITSEWKGKIVMNGTFEDPLFDGNLYIVKGEYNLNGKIFNLAQGNIHFGGPIGKKTTLYIVASRDIDTIQAEIILKGPISKPSISFRSNPPMSQREVLSYILFNRGFSDITSDQGNQLSHSFMELRTSEEGSSSTDLLSRLRNKIGIDRLDFGNAGEGGENNYSLQIGKNITDNIAFSVNKSIMDAIYRYSIEVKLRKNLKAQAEVGVGDAYQLKTSLKWKKDY